MSINMGDVEALVARKIAEALDDVERGVSSYASYRRQAKEMDAVRAKADAAKAWCAMDAADRANALREIPEASRRDLFSMLAPMDRVNGCRDLDAAAVDLALDAVEALDKDSGLNRAWLTFQLRAPGTWYKVRSTTGGAVGGVEGFQLGRQEIRTLSESEYALIQSDLDLLVQKDRIHVEPLSIDEARTLEYDLWRATRPRPPCPPVHEKPLGLRLGDAKAPRSSKRGLADVNKRVA